MGATALAPPPRAGQPHEPVSSWLPENLEASHRSTHARSPRTRATHTHKIHDDTTGPECGDCMLAGGCCDRDPNGT